MKHRLIIYASKYKTSKECAELLADKFFEHVVVCDIKEVARVDLTKYDQVILGAGVYGSLVAPKFRKWVKVNLDILLEKDVGLYLCAYHEQKCSEYFKLNFPIELLEQAKVKMCFGSRMKLDELSWIDRQLIHIIQFFDKMPIETQLYKERISYFAKKMAEGEHEHE